MPFRFDFALSFAGSNRGLARKIRGLLKAEGFTVFYDEDYEHEMIGVDASLYLREVYTRQSRFCIVLISREYDRRQWTQLERESIQSRELIGERGILIPVKVEDYSPEWLPPTRIYFDLTNRPVKTLIEVLKRMVERKDGHVVGMVVVEDSRKESFLRGICAVVKSHPGGDAAWAHKLFPQEVAGLIGESTPLPDLVNKAKAMGSLDTSFETTTACLKRDWDQFAPLTKRRFIDEIRKHNLADVFTDLLFLTLEEEAYLRIAWDAADARYREEKSKAYEQCREIGIDLQHHTITLRYDLVPTMKKLKQILGDLLRKRVKIDLEAVMEGAGQVKLSYAEDVSGRAQSAWFDLLEDLRKCWLGHGLSGRYTEQCLEEFNQMAQSICNSPLAPRLLCERTEDGSYF